MAQPPTSPVRAVGAGVGLLIVVLVYTPAGLGDARRYWAAAAALAVGVLVAEALIDVRARVRVPGVVPAGLLAVLLAAYLCVPETDQFFVAGLMPVSLLVCELVRRRQFGVEWYVVAAASVGWAAMFGTSGRQSALIGALFAWWPILLPWSIMRLTGVRSQTSMIASMMIGAAAALAFARTGGLSDSTRNAVLVVVIGSLASAAGAWSVARAGARRQPPLDQ